MEVQSETRITLKITLGEARDIENALEFERLNSDSTSERSLQVLRDLSATLSNITL